MTYADAISFLDSRVNYEKLHGKDYTVQVFKLERVEKFYRLLGAPAAGVPTVHVTGTKGKGSTSAMIAGMLEHSGMRTGCFQSPHITYLGERFQVNRQSCSPEELAELVAAMKPVLECMDAAELAGETRWGHATWFEITTMMAFLHFQRRKVDAMVLEVGMGGRLDATNICTPLVSVLTNISLDHTQQLGATLEEVAYEKAGIIKPAVPVVSGVQQPGLRALTRQIAEIRCAEVYQAETDFSWEISEDGQETLLFHDFHPEIGDRAFPVGMRGRHQRENAALAVQVVKILREKYGFHIPVSAVQKSLLETRLPGRLEAVAGYERVFTDVAHNDASISGTLAWLATTFPRQKKQFIFAVSADKNWQAVLQKIVASAEEIYLTEYHSSMRAVPVDELYDFCTHLRSTAVFHKFHLPAEALKAALQAKQPEDVLMILGSFFLLSDLSPHLPQN